ncbi:TIM barrel protein [Kineosporia sp. NBRC 101731]|uniref:TIM barrel protein n=1 Tax=Kineosporia sp. NBRC 101731 TaxID=3032199 RepID=UPI0024A35996|nr:TIM barrel protein [Kineosporia sp. NBRC 101731]GLY29439.1 inosose dehydratase [Kineosporia sp. NBRC 101731]
MTSDVSRSRTAGAPISWGVCEVPGWGYQMPAPRVLAEMRDLGLRATEFGPSGFLPVDPRQKASLLADFGLEAVGGFLPVVLHRAEHDPLPEVDVFADACSAAGAEVVVLAAVTGLDGYDVRPELDPAQWKTLLANLDLLNEHLAGRGLLAVVHPHMGTLIENDGDVRRVLTGSSIALCIDTGHLVAAGADPVAITLAAPERVGHVHLKDVDAALAARVTGGELSFSDAVANGLWTVLGEGSVDLESMIGALQQVGYQGWYVLEHDVMLGQEPPPGAGPVHAVSRSLDYLRRVLA